MIKILTPLAGLALIAAGAVHAAPAKPRASAKARAAKSAPRPAPAPVVAAPVIASAQAQLVADWIAASGDNRALPYAVIDKQAASLILYDAKGKPLEQVPVLIGIAPGDDATPGVGSKKLGEIGPAEKTTPAGRFLAKFGYAAGRQRVLWVDYTNSVAIHAIPADAAKTEQRRERMLSPAADDNRITFGCINVPHAFYGAKLRPVFQKKGGYVYVLPDTKPLEEVFPRLRVHALTAGTASL
ncbi:L,D-transpeptidase [Sphingomonas jatrophae]|uniref:L,D-transpeptidase catalytic domain n=1 Tax=Sphingomonas jatrophae TaxID=1166337 RepID=A0A1I6KYW1_9SPHN|nr:L,D-transpeptidase [Sphingomonas jatrophae]SFR96426.1 hypothetical protein SAMN05192580_2001 [Sphingomonas jatrophae]